MSGASEKILLIDGHSIINRAFYGMPDLTSSDGRHTGAVLGFLNIILRILEEEKPDYLTVAFDLHAPTFRHKMYDAYKGTRKGMPEELREQVPLLKQMLEAMDVRIVTLEGYEADDILGTLAKKAEAEGKEAVILSGDRDLLQLASQKIMIRLPKTVKGTTTVENYHWDEVVEKYQVTPPQIIELKALMGDSSDNIPGLPGVGEKTAVKIISQWGSIENAYAHAAEVKPPKASKAFIEHWDLAVLSKTLATINTQSPVDFSFESARMGNLFTKEAYELCRELEFKNILTRFELSEEETASGQELKETFFSCEDPDGIRSLLETAVEGGAAGIYVICEKDQIFGMGLTVSEEETYYIPMKDPEAAGVIRDVLGSETAKGMKIRAMDLKALLKIVSLEDPKQVFDAGVAAYLLNPLKSSYSYEDIAKEYMNGRILPSKEELLGKEKFVKAAQQGSESIAAIACYGAYTAYMSEKPLLEALKEEGMTAVYSEIEIPLIFTLNAMENIGIKVQGEELREYGEKLTGRIRELEQAIYEQAGESFNINSPKQLGVILFEKMGIKGGKKTKTGYSTAADLLEKLAPDHPIISDILEYRQYTKLKSTYADGLSAQIASDGRIHSTFNQTITATGRISSTEPNLQNIPVRTELGRLLRKVFVPEEGYVFLDADYSQIELRVLAHMSGDQKLIEAYRKAQDIHAITASEVFHVPFEEVTPLLRRNAKAVNFGIVYGISSFGLSQDLSITPKEAQQYINKYFETYPGIKLFLDDQVRIGKEQGEVRTLYGRKRPVPELASSNFMQRSFGERVAMNSPIQGTAADIIKIAMIRVYDRLKKEHLASRLILQVHDELLIETRVDELEKVSAILMEEMKGAAELAVDLDVDMHTGENWYDAK